MKGQQGWRAWLAGGFVSAALVSGGSGAWAAGAQPVAGQVEEIGQARDAGAMLEARFRTPPASARARLDWRLPDGGAASSAVAADLDWMSRAGLGGLQIENASASPQALRLVAQGAQAQGLDLAIALPAAEAVDSLDGAAMSIWLNRCFDDLQAALGAGMLGADGVRGLVNGTQEVALPATTPLMNAQFARLRGYDPAPWLPVLSGASAREASAQDQARFLRDWRRTRADLLNSERFGMIAQVAHERGLKLYGAAPEGTAPDDAMAMRMRADVPMVVVAQAALTGARGAGLAGERRIAEAASVAHVYGQNWVAGEVLPDMGPSAIAPWTVTPHTMRGALDLAFVNGVNRVILPARIGASGAPWFGPQQSWAGLAQGFSDYLARTSLMLQQGHNVADLAELADEEAPRGDAPPRDDAVPPGYARDFVTAAMVDGSLMVDGHDLVSQSGARYRALWLGGAARPMTLRTLARLADLVAAGATVVGPRPLASPALADAQGDAPARWQSLAAMLWPEGQAETVVGQGRVIAGGNAGVALARMGVAPDFRPVGSGAGSDAGSDPAFVHRTMRDGESWFLVNRADHEVRFDGHFRVMGKAAEIWHAETGQIEAASYRIEGGETRVPLVLAPRGSLFVVFRKAASARAVQLAPVVERPLVTLTGPWALAFQGGRGAPARLNVPALTRLDRSPIEGVRHFSGEVAYGLGFRPPRGWKRGMPLWLDLGEVHDLAQVRVNGRDMGARWQAPYRYDIGGAVRGGTNRLVVQVAGSWANRVIGDAAARAAGAKAAIAPAGAPLTADIARAPLVPSGLVGPVVLGTTVQETGNGPAHSAGGGPTEARSTR